MNLQKTLLENKADRAALKLVDMEAGRSVRRLSLRFGGSHGSKQPATVGQELESVTANTKDRIKADLACSTAMDCTVMSLSEGDTL